MIMEKTTNEAMTLAEEIEKGVQAVADPATVSALEISKKNKELADKAMKEAEKAADDLVKDGQPDSHQDTPSEIKAEMKKLHLAESLEEMEEEVLNENSIEDQHAWFRTDNRTSELLDNCFAYLRDLKGDSDFADFAQEHLRMTPEELLFYCDIDIDDMDESLNEADDSEYPYTFSDGQTHFRRKNLTNMDEIEISYPAFTIKYNVISGIQTKPGDPVDPFFRKDSLAKLDMVRGEQKRVEAIFSQAFETALVKKGYKDFDVDGHALIGVPSEASLYAGEVGESLNEAVKTSTLTQLRQDLGTIPHVTDSISIDFSSDESQATLHIHLDGEMDIDTIYDILDDYSGEIAVDEDDDEIRVRVAANDATNDIGIPEDLYDEIYTQLATGGRMIPGKEGGKGWVTDYGAGYDEESQIFSVDGGRGIGIRVSPGHEFDKKGYETSFEPAKAIADKYKDLGVYYTERGEIEKTLPHRVAKILTIWIPENVKAPGRDERVKTEKQKAKERANIFACYVDSLKKARGEESDEIYAKAKADKNIDKIQLQELTNLYARYRDLDESLKEEVKKGKYAVKHENGKYVSKDHNVGSFDRAAKFETEEEAETFISDNGKDKTWKDHYTIVDISKDESIDEAVIKSPFSDYKPWEGAIDTWNKIKDTGKLGELETLVDELYSGEIDDTKLNDLLWFEKDWVLETLGIEGWSDDYYKDGEEEAKNWFDN